MEAKVWKRLVEETTVNRVLLFLVLCLLPFLTVLGTVYNTHSLSGDTELNALASGSRPWISRLSDANSSSNSKANASAVVSSDNDSGEGSPDENSSDALFCKLLTDSKLLAHYSDGGVNTSWAKLKMERRYQLHYFDNETVATFCSGGYNPIGIGNALSIYWATRAVAFFEGCTFVFPDKSVKSSNQSHFCNKQLLRIFNPAMTSISPRWTWHLSKVDRTTLFTQATDNGCVDSSEAAANKCFVAEDFYLSTANNAMDRVRNNDSLLKNVSPSDALQRIHSYFRWIHAEGRSDWSLPYHCNLILLQYNPYFMPIVRRETLAAINRFSKAIGERMPTTHLPDGGNTLKVVIHVRCGDTLVGKNGRRVLLSLRFYQAAAEFIWGKQPERVQKWLMENPSDVHVEIISQLDVSNAHLQADIDGIEQCTQIVGFMADTFRTDLFSNLKPTDYSEHLNVSVNLKPSVVIRGNSSADADYYRMVTAGNFINSGSSFSLNAALASEPESAVVFPSKGPWGGIGQLLMDQSAVFANHLWVDVDKHKMTAIAHSFWNHVERFYKWFPAN